MSDNANSNNNVAGGSQADPNATTPGQAPTTNSNPNGQAPQGQQQSQLTKIEDLPADIQALIKSLREENAEARTRAKKEAEEKEKAEQERLKQQGEWQKLAEQSQARVSELEPVAESYKKLSDIMAKQIAATIKDWPAEVKAFDPGENASIEARLDWMEKSKPLVEKLTPASARPGNSPSPRPVGGVGANGGSGETDLVKELRSTGRYNYF